MLLKICEGCKFIERSKQPTWLLLFLHVAACFLFIGSLFSYPADSVAQLDGIMIGNPSVRAGNRHAQSQVLRSQLELKIQSKAGEILSWDQSSDGRYLAVTYSDGFLRIWDLQRGRIVKRFSSRNFRDSIIKVAPDGTSLFLVESKSRLIRWSFQKRTWLTLFSLERGDVSTLSHSLDGALTAIGTTKGEIYIVENETGKLINRLSLESGSITVLLFEGSSQLIAAGDSLGNVRVIEINSQLVLHEARPVNNTIKEMLFSENVDELTFQAEGGRIFSWSLQSKENNQPSLVYENSSLVSVSLNRKIVLLRDKNRLIVAPIGKGARSSSTAFPKAVSFKIDPIRDVVFIANKEGFIRAWDFGTGKPLFTLIATTNGWAALDNKGRFDGSESALKDISWLAKEISLPIENFADEYYEPGMITKKIMQKGELLTSPKISLEEGILPPPTVKFSSPKMVQYKGENFLQFSVRTIDQGGGMSEVRTYHNGKVVGKKGIVDNKTSKKGDKTFFDVLYRVRPVSGRNHLRSIASSTEGIFGKAEEGYVGVSIKLRKPSLRIVTVGINKYQSSALNLNYAIPDAMGIIEAFSKTSEIFEDIYITRVFDYSATKKGILSVLKNLENTHPEDVVVLYFASHGESVGNKFYILPNDIPYPLTETLIVKWGISSDDLREILENIGARRILLLIDACKSGTAVEDISDHIAKKALRKLGMAIGLHVISATTQEQNAVEVHKLGHGVFTYSVMQALEGKADNNPQDGKVTVLELVDYVGEEVPRLSQEYANYQHWPLVYSHGFDFTLLDNNLHPG